MTYRFACLLFVLSLGSCGSDPKFYAADHYPQRLSAWAVISADLSVPASSEVYELNTPLFSDYANKLRTLYLPPGHEAKYSDYEAFEFPVGTIVTKTFYYAENELGQILIDQQNTSNKRVLETRLLVKQANGWDALPYIWEGDDAYLAITGKLLKLETDTGKILNYLVPSKNQCASCHATDHTSGALQPIGLKARHLNRSSSGVNQLTALENRGWLMGLPDLGALTPNADFADTTAALDHRARSYLDINCGHCHNAKGPADTSGLLLDYANQDIRALGVCKPPIAAGRGSGGFNYGIVPGQAELSILRFRMASEDLAAMMPELGRSLVHTQGTELVRDWINQMQGECR
ncbi:MAG: putative repeat protein (TIGR03806 family) [Limisphaerales bacterium]